MSHTCFIYVQNIYDNPHFPYVAILEKTNKHKYINERVHVIRKHAVLGYFMYANCCKGYSDYAINALEYWKTRCNTSIEGPVFQLFMIDIFD